MRNKNLDHETIYVRKNKRFLPPVVEYSLSIDLFL